MLPSFGPVVPLAWTRTTCCACRRHARGLAHRCGVPLQVSPCPRLGGPVDAATLNGRIMMSKYTRDGVFLAGPVPVDNNGAAATGRHGVALAVDAGGSVIATWWERKSDGTQPEAIFRRRLNNTLGFLDNETQVNNPPGLPAGAQRARRGDVATDSSSNFLITWEASVNDPSALTWNAFARGFSSTATTLKNDFRADLAPRSAAVQAPRAARSPFTNCYAEAWRDNRSGHYDVYTRLVAAVPQ